MAPAFWPASGAPRFRFVGPFAEGAEGRGPTRFAQGCLPAPAACTVAEGRLTRIEGSGASECSTSLLSAFSTPLSWTPLSLIPLSWILPGEVGELWALGEFHGAEWKASACTLVCLWVAAGAPLLIWAFVCQNPPAAKSPGLALAVAFWELVRGLPAFLVFSFSLFGAGDG